MLCLVDCNNFFASCERAQDPSLDGKPIVVLSNVGGIILARSEEAKALGIPMGGASFEYEMLFRKYRVHVATCHFSLYGALSRKVMEILRGFSPDIEIYSVDEAFLKMDVMTFDQAHTIRKTIYDQTRIPVSLGIGATKTLCKAAIHFAKPRPDGIFFMEDTCLAALPIEEVWGIGPHLAARLRAKAIYTACDLVAKSDYFLKKELSVIGLRTAWELRGMPCLSFDEMAPPKQSISMSRSFPKPLFYENDLAPILASYTTDVSDELRSSDQVASVISVWLSTSLFGRGKKYAQSASSIFPEPTSFTPSLLIEAKSLLSQIYAPGYAYKKVGVMLSGLLPASCVQQDLFSPKTAPRDARLQSTLDHITARYGPDSIHIGSEI
jgi:DNA polymerase V